VAKFEPGGIQMFLHSKNKQTNKQTSKQTKTTTRKNPPYFPVVLDSLGKYKNAVLL